jgi:hypothetical protein
MTNLQKECFKCKTVKPLNEFYKHSRMADGHLNKCKSCAKDDYTNHRNNNLDKVRSYDRARSSNSERIKASIEITRAWRQEDKRRSVAHSKVARAIRNGQLTRQVCVRCNNPKSVAHHDDYDKPLDVMWLCQPCHAQRHKELK